MRIRTIAGSVLAAAGLTAALTGAAGASTPSAPEPPPPGAAVMATCEDGEPTVRHLSEEERAQRDDRMAEPGAVPGRRIQLAPGEKGVLIERPAAADGADLPAPDVHRTEVRPATPSGEPGEELARACAVHGEKPQE